MKMHKLTCLSAALILAASVGAGAIPALAAEPSASGDFFSDTAIAENYGGLASPSYQGENGVWLLAGTADENGMLLREGNVWSSGTGEGLAAVEGSLYTPGEEGVIWKWQAPSGGTAHFKGIVYNAVTVSEAGDLSSYGVEARTADTSTTRDGVSLSVLHVSGETKSSLYTADETSDFTLFTDETLSVRKGDSVLIRIDGKTDDTCDGVRLYMGVDFDEKIAAYDLTKQENLKAGVLEDITGNGHDLNTNYDGFTADPVKGMQFHSAVSDGKPVDSNSQQMFYDLDFGTHDFTDDLTDFTIRIAYTLGDDGGAAFTNDWTYIFSTTSHTLPTRGLALCINSLGSSDSNGKHKYALNLRFDVAGEQGFFGGTNCWTNGLVEGSSYVTVINVSTTKHKIETFTTGDYEGGWHGTNKNAGGTAAATTEDTWSMDNSNLGTAGEGLLLGAFNSAGQNSFNGWISSFEIAPMHTSFDASQVAGSEALRGSELNYAAANSVSAIAEKAELKDDEAAILSSFATKTVTLNLIPTGTLTGSVTWNDIVFDGSEYYLLGSVQAAGCDVNGLTAKALVDAKAVKLSVGGKYVGFVTAAADEEYDLDRLFDFVPLGSHATWYTDKAMTEEYTGGAATILYGKVEESEWTINYELDGGTNSPDNPATYRYSDGTVTLKAPTKEGYTFEGWYLEDTFSTKIGALEASEMREITIYAKWTKNPEDAGGGSQGGTEGDKESGKGGCGSFITGGVLVALVTACGAAILVSRKRH